MDFSLNVLTRRFSPYILLVVIVLTASAVLASLAVYALSITLPEFPDFGGAENAAFDDYSYVVNFTMTFLTTVIGLLLLGLGLGVALVGFLLYSLANDRRKMLAWREIGFACERIEFLQGSRIRLNNTEIILNKAQLATLQQLAESRLKGEALHPAEMQGENATQAVKRLREELGARLIEKTFIMNHRGKGYWVDVDPKKIKGLDT